MADFQVNVVRVAAIEPIEGADRIELAVVGEYRSIVMKGQFKPGDRAVYLPEASVLPVWLIEKLNLVGKLSGAAKNRIKAIKLKGCLSQGILLPVETNYPQGLPFGQCAVTGAPHPEDANECFCNEGDDVQEFLGIKKHDPFENLTAEQRQKFYGHCANIGSTRTVRYDFENWKKHPNVFAEGDEVVITEKLHGTMCCFAYYPGLNHPDLPGDVFAYSKGLGAGGNVFKWNDPMNEGNVYLKAFHRLSSMVADFESVESAFSEEGGPMYGVQTIIDRLGLAIDRLATGYEVKGHSYDDPYPFYLFGEVAGEGVQDLGYGMAPCFKAFDLWVGSPQDGGFLDAIVKFKVFKEADIPHVPILYQGPFNREAMLALTDGKTTLGGGHIREGVVITSTTEESVHRFGRKIAKNVSGEYLTRKGENATEFA